MVIFMNRDGRESNVVTKVFNVEYAEPLTSSSSESDRVDNALNFQQDLPKRTSVSVQNKYACLK